MRRCKTTFFVLVRSGPTTGFPPLRRHLDSGDISKLRWRLPLHAKPDMVFKDIFHLNYQKQLV